MGQSPQTDEELALLFYRLLLLDHNVHALQARQWVLSSFSRKEQETRPSLQRWRRTSTSL